MGSEILGYWSLIGGVGIVKLAITSDDGDVLLLEADGCITQDNVSQQLNDPMRSLLGEQGFGRKVVLSLDGIEFVDSSGIGWLIASHKRFRKEGGKLVIHSVQPVVTEILKILKFNQVLVIAKNQRAALAAVNRD